MLFALILLVGWLLAELYVAIRVADAIGVLAMIVLLIASWPLGMWALRSQGAAAWRRLGAAIANGRAPGREVLDGALVLVGGVLLIVPGFISDLVGACALFAPTRALMRGLLARSIASRLVVRTVTPSARPDDVDSTAHDLDQPRLRP